MNIIQEAIRKLQSKMIPSEIISYPSTKMKLMIIVDKRGKEILRISKSSKDIVPDILCKEMDDIIDWFTNDTQPMYHCIYGNEELVIVRDQIEMIRIRIVYNCVYDDSH